MIPLGNFTQIYKDTSTIIPKVEKEDGTIINNQFEILNENKSFYEKLYNKKYPGTSDIGEITVKKISENLKNINHTKLTQEEQDNLEGKITIKEAGGALKNMKNDKTPGSDGYSAELFKFFWKDLQVFIVNSLNYGYDIGELSVTQKLGIITCLPIR